MKSGLTWILAERRGSKTAEQFGLTTLPVDPRVIAEKRGITIGERDLTGCSGCLIRKGDAFGILYSSGLSNAGAVNFTISHELGHYFLDGHAEALFPDGDGLHQSAGPFRSADPREREADHFAVGLLMPEKPFVRAMRSAGEGLDAIESLAATCGTSLTSTAIRYATLSEDPVAVIVASGGKVEFCFLSECLRSIHGIEWLGKGTKVPRGTVTAKLASNLDDVRSAARREGGCAFSDWLDGAPEADCSEEVVGLGRFEQTLTILWSNEALDEDDSESEDGL